MAKARARVAASVGSADAAEAAGIAPSDSGIQRGPESPAAAVAGIERAVRAAVIVGLALWTVQFARGGVAGGENTVLHLPNLIFHEAGHVIFGFFGRFVAVLGGSLNQVLVPIVLAVAFLRQDNPFAAAVCAWWAGENLLDLAPYIADARALQLVLIGGHTGAEVEGHDWEYLLTQTHLMMQDVMIGRWAFRLGLMIMSAALVWAAIATARKGPADLGIGSSDYAA